MKKVTKTKKPGKNATLGERIKYARTNLSMKQDDLADKLSIDRTLLPKYENGKRPLYADTLKRIAETLNVSTDYLLGLTDFESPDIDEIAINKQTGLTLEAIKILKELNIKYNGIFLNTINFLIEQENYLVGNNDKKCISIIKPIDDYLSISLKTNNPVYITERVVKRDNEFQSKFEREFTQILAKRVINEQDLIDNMLLQDIQNFITYAKPVYTAKYKDRG